MAGVKISALPAAAAANLSDIFPVVQGGVTSKETLQQVVNLFNSSIQLNSTAQVTGLAAALAGFLPLAGGTMTGNLILNGNPSVPNQAANKAYVDAVAQGFTVVLACQAATTANLNAVYANGAAGVGATLTNNGAMAAFAVDGYSANLNDRILVKNQTTTFQNGIYTVTTVGSGAVNWVLTRSTDYDQAPSEIKPGTLVAVNAGTVNATTSWLETATVTTIGADPILFSQFTFAPSAFLQVANNLSDVANAATSRTNLGLGNAAVKAVSDNTKATVASVSGATTIGHIATFADVNGTIQDGGASNAFLLAANNLSDVASAPTSFYNITTGGYTLLAISGATATVNADFGKLAVCTGASSYTVQLANPAGNAGKFIEFSIQTTSNALVTLTPLAGLISGQASVIYGTFEGCKLYCDGSNYYIVEQNLQPVSCSVYRSVAQAFNNTPSKVQYNVKLYDVGSFYDNVTNFRFLPKYPGKYAIVTNMELTGVAVPAFTVVAYIYKNGSAIKLAAVNTVSGGSFTTAQAVGDCQLNGTTDYIEGFAGQNNGGSTNCVAGASTVYMDIKRISNF